MNFRIAPPGKYLIGIGLAAAFAAFLCNLAPSQTVFLLGLGFAGFSAYFFRNPERPIVYGPDEVCCPADGTVLSVEKEGNNDVTTVRIFLSVFNVHVQWMPISGKIEKIQYKNGAFKFANAKEAARENEYNRIVINDGTRRLALDQIAGYVARRIDCWVREGDEVRRGQQLGVIYFGSQVAVHFPPGAEILVKPGQQVQGGITCLARWIQAAKPSA